MENGEGTPWYRSHVDPCGFSMAVSGRPVEVVMAKTDGRHEQPGPGSRAEGRTQIARNGRGPGPPKPGVVQCE